MFHSFLDDKRANFAVMTAIAVVPLMGGLALALDYSQVTSQRQATMNALDAAGIATARRIVEGASDEQAKLYAKQFFEANLGKVKASNTTLTVTLPASNTGGGTLKLDAKLKYQATFLPTAAMLLGRTESGLIQFSARSEIRLKNTLEVALVLDNSGSMDFIGTGSGKKRMVLLKEAAKQLVDTIAAQSAQMKQLERPVQFGVVPFAASVNIGADKAGETWMDQDGISPIQHENFDWTTLSKASFPQKYAEKVGSIWYARGADWGNLENKPLTRFSLYKAMQRVTSKTYVEKFKCTATNSRGVCTTWQDGYTYTYGSPGSWAGCVESRPYPYNANDATPAPGTPATLYVPMFAPDETDLKDSSARSADSNWWPDVLTDTSTSASNNLSRQKYMPKYLAYGVDAFGATDGPNASCTTTPVLPLTDVSDTAGVDTVKAAIDGMISLGATNVPEGMAWGWRVLSSVLPFNGGRPETERGNDKVLIVLTDGANTYYTPTSLGYNDLAANKSTYSSYGYAGRTPTGYSYPRIFLNTPSTVSKTDYSNANYTKALNAQFDTLCGNAKAAGVMVMTVSLDLDEKDTTEKAQMDALKACASDSRFRKDPKDATKADKNYWNTTGKDLSATFKKIADELSNLRIVG